MEGIDILGDKIMPVVVSGAAYHPVDLFHLKEKNTYDLVFLIHPFPDYRLREHGLPLYPPKKTFAKILSLLRRGGHVVGIAYGAPPEEYALFEEFPKKNIVVMERYANEKARKADYERGQDTFSNSMVLIGRKSGKHNFRKETLNDIQKGIREIKQGKGNRIENIARK